MKQKANWKKTKHMSSQSSPPVTSILSPTRTHYLTTFSNSKISWKPSYNFIFKFYLVTVPSLLVLICIILNYVYTCVSMCEYLHMSAFDCGGQICCSLLYLESQESSGPLEEQDMLILGKTSFQPHFLPFFWFALCPPFAGGNLNQ